MSTAGGDPVATRLEDLLSETIATVGAGMTRNQQLAQVIKANRLMIGDLLMPIVLRRVAEALHEAANALSCVLVLFDVSGDILDAVGCQAGVAEVAQLRESLEKTGDAPDGYIDFALGDSDGAHAIAYLSFRAQTDVLTSERHELLDILGHTAAIAIENAKLFDEARLRQHWLQTSTEIFRQLLSGSADEHLDLITARARDVADADVVSLAVGRSGGTSLQIRVTSGRGSEGLIGYDVPIEGTYHGKVMMTETALLLDGGENSLLKLPDGSELTGPAMLLPLIGAGDLRGVLGLIRNPGRPVFTPVHLELAAAFASQAILALDLSEARLHQQRMMLLEDRDRIARDLHDHVIQRLFATGLSVESTAKSLRKADNSKISQRLMGEVGEIDAIIRELRSSIRRLRGPLAVGADEQQESARLVATPIPVPGTRQNK